MKKKLRTAVIGTGYMGTNHARVYSKISNLVAVSDTYINIAKQTAKKFGSHYYQNYKEMLLKENINAISVVVPTIYHKQIAIDCLKHKVATLVEKPIATTVKDGQEIIKTAQNYNTILMVGHIERFNPIVIKVKKIIEKGEIGKIVNLLAIRVGVAPPKTPNSDVSSDLAIHDVDIFNFLLNDLPHNSQVIKDKIYKNNVADWTSIMLEYKSTVGYIQSNWVTPIKMRKLYITGTKGYLEMDYINQNLNFYKSNSAGTENKQMVNVSKAEPLKEELNYFIKAIENNMVLDNQYAIEALKIVLSEN